MIYKTIPQKYLSSNKKPIETTTNKVLSDEAPRLSHENCSYENKIGLIYKNDRCELFKGPFNCNGLKSIINCEYFQMVPCTVGPLAGEYEMWMNENGKTEDTINEVATKVYGNQVFGGTLYGNILLVKSGTIE